VGDGATSSAIEANSMRFLGGTEKSFGGSGGVGVDLREKSIGVVGVWLEMAKSAALKLYLGRDAGLSRNDLVGVDRFSDNGDEIPSIVDDGGGVSILLDDELDDDFGGFMSRVLLSASCCSFTSDGDKYALLAANVLFASGSGMAGYLDCEKYEDISCSFVGVMCENSDE